MSSAAYTISYFDIRGLAEMPRLLLTFAGVPFNDDRVKFEKQADGSFDRGNWPERKPNTPYGQMPLLTLADGTVIAQSGAIMRYLARQHGLNGANETEAALIDAGFEALKDIRQGYYLHRSDATKAAEYWSKKLHDEIAYFSKNIKGPFFAGSKPSFVDLTLYYMLWSYHETEQEVGKAAVEKIFADHPKVKAIFDAISNDPKISAYVAKRKQTIF